MKTAWRAKTQHKPSKDAVLLTHTHPQQTHASMGAPPTTHPPKTTPHNGLLSCYDEVRLEWGKGAGEQNPPRSSKHSARSFFGWKSSKKKKRRQYAKLTQARTRKKPPVFYFCSNNCVKIHPARTHTHTSAVVKFRMHNQFFPLTIDLVDQQKKKKNRRSK